MQLIWFNEGESKIFRTPVILKLLLAALFYHRSPFKTPVSPVAAVQV